MTEQEKGTLPEKLIVCLHKERNRGKTQTLKELADKLLVKSSPQDIKWHNPKNPPKNSSDCKKDICFETVVNGKRIGLNTDGDTPGEIRKWLREMAHNNCEIIFCACRKGEEDCWGTLAAVKEPANEFDYTLVWTAPYTDDSIPGGNKSKPLQEILNRKKAEDLWGFVE